MSVTKPRFGGVFVCGIGSTRLIVEQGELTVSTPVNPGPDDPGPLPPIPPIEQPDPPIHEPDSPVKEPDPDRLPDEEPLPNPDENPDPPQRLGPSNRRPQDAVPLLPSWK